MIICRSSRTSVLNDMNAQLRIISWNTAHRRDRAEAQAHALLSRSPDLVALQEVTSKTVETLRQILTEGGLLHWLYSDPPSTPTPRSYGVFIASRFPLEPQTPFSIPWQEKALSATASGPGQSIELHNVHVPNGSAHGWTKIETLEGIYNQLAKRSSVHRILCGDFNTPQLELPSGEVITWAQRVRVDGTIRTKRFTRGGPGTRWDSGERQVLTGLAKYDLNLGLFLVFGETYSISLICFCIVSAEDFKYERFH